MKKKITLRTIKPYLFLIPIFSLLIIFKYIPFGMAIEKSFFNWNGANMNEFIGFQNFVEAFQDKIFLESIKKAFVVMVVQVLIVITVPLITAELLYAVKSTRAQYVVRTAFTFPMVVPSVVIILLWKWILNGDTGVLNAFLKGIGLSSLAQPWLGSAKTALGSILAVGFPWLGMVSLGGMPFLLYFGALQSIPRDLFEAADLDGVNLFQRIRCIDLPMLASQIKLMVGGGAASLYDRLEDVQFFEEEVRTAVHAAENAGTYVMVHVYVPEGIRQAIRAGVKSIEHGHLIDEETMKMIADNGVWLSMQPFTADDNTYPSEEQQRKHEMIVAGTDNTYKLAKKYGVRLAWGTDLLFNPAKAKDQNRGIAKLARWFSNYEILKMVTRDNAELLALSGRRNPYPGPLGTIETDALADLLLVDGNPLENIELLTEPEKNFLLIVKDGTIYKRQGV